MLTCWVYPERLFSIPHGRRRVSARASLNIPPHIFLGWINQAVKCSWIRPYKKGFEPRVTKPEGATPQHKVAAINKPQIWTCVRPKHRAIINRHNINTGTINKLLLNKVRTVCIGCDASCGVLEEPHLEMNSSNSTQQKEGYYFTTQ